MHKLLRGLYRFQTKVFPVKHDQFERLASGQKPRTMLITCSDSRVMPEMILQADPGELFVLRNAGNIVPAYGTVAGGEAATIEYAVNVVKVKQIIICGHSHCGAMLGLLNPDAVKPLPAVSQWLGYAEETRKRVAESYPKLSGPELLRVTVEENVRVQMENLLTHPSVAAKAESGELSLYGWVHTFETGEVTSYSPRLAQFQPVLQRRYAREQEVHSQRHQEFAETENERTEFNSDSRIASRPERTS